MNPTPESIPERNLLSEIDEITATVRVLLQAVANIGKELTEYKGLWSELAQQATRAIEAMGTHADQQNTLNQRFADQLVTTSELFEALEKRLAAVENGYRIIIP